MIETLMPCSKGMRGCRLDCAHRRFVQDYAALRDEQQLRAEAATGMYGTELARYFGTDGEGPGEENRWTFQLHMCSYQGDDYPYPDPNRRTRVQLSQAELEAWALARKLNAPKVAAQHELESAQALTLIQTFGCDQCDPILTITETAQGPNLRGKPQVQHQMGCPQDGAA